MAAKGNGEHWQCCSLQPLLVHSLCNREGGPNASAPAVKPRLVIPEVREAVRQGCELGNSPVTEDKFDVKNPTYSRRRVLAGSYVHSNSNDQINDHDWRRVVPVESSSLCEIEP